MNQDGLAPPLLCGSAIRRAARQLTRVASPKLVEARPTVILGERNLHDNGAYREGFFGPRSTILPGVRRCSCQAEEVFAGPGPW